MWSLFFFTVAAASLATAASHERSVAPEGAVVVDNSATPAAGTFSTVQAAIDSLTALNQTTTTPQTIFIHAGVYPEQIYIPSLSFNLTVQGATADARDYHGNLATITAANTSMMAGSNDLASTVRVHSANTRFYNLNMANTFTAHEREGTQNGVVSANQPRQGYYGCQFLGFQDTILAERGAQLYAKSLIVGAIDFIYGQRGQAFVDACDIRINGYEIENPGHNFAWITAPGRVNNLTDIWYVISNSTVDKINDTIPDAIGFLGRPWRTSAKAIFQNTYLGSVINARGWDYWSEEEPNTENATFAEFGNYGPGSAGVRANFSSVLNEVVTVETVLGAGWENEWWVDLDYVVSL